MLSLSMFSCCKAGGAMVAGAVKASKEEERNKKVVRNLLKLRDNARCINCDNSGPRFVCLDFGTFVCIICSGIHREFMHRVKSISVSKFTQEEVMALQDGGNKRARDIYFREWDSRRQSLPHCRDIDRLREFIRIVYVERRYMGNRSERTLILKPIEKEDSNEDTNSKNRSPDDADERSGGAGDGKNNERNSIYDCDDERTSGGYDESATPKEGVLRRSFSQLLRNKIRPSRSSGNKMNEAGSVSEADQKVEEKLGEQQKTHRLARDEDSILQRSTSSSSMESVTKKADETKSEISKSMVASLGANPEPASPQKITKIIVSNIKTESTTASSNDNNWASFESFGEIDNAAPAPSSVKADAGLDLLSLEMVPSSTTPASSSQSTAQQSMPPTFNDFSNKESWILSLVPNPQELLSSPTFTSSQSVSNKTHVTSESVGPSSDRKSGGRQPLPEYLFVGAPLSAPSYAIQSHRVAYGMQMQYPSVVNMHAIYQQPQRANPFGKSNEYPSIVPQTSAPQWIQTQSLPYAAVQQQFYTSRMGNGTYMEQQTQGNLLLLGHQGVGGYGSGGPGIRVNGGNPFA